MPSRDTMFEYIDRLSKENMYVKLLVHIFAFFTFNTLIMFLSKLSITEEDCFNDCVLPKKGFVLQIQCGVFGIWAERIHYNPNLSFYLE